MNRLRHQNYKNENIEKRKLNNIPKNINQRPFIKNTSHDWLSNYISISIKKIGGVKDKINRSKDYSKPTRVKSVHSGGKKARKLKIKIKKTKYNIIKNVRKIVLDLKNKVIKTEQLHILRVFLNQKKIIAKQQEQVTFTAIIILNMKVLMMEKKW